MKKILLSKGQAVLIVLLIMVVALTVGISISLRSTKNIRLSTRTEESQRAFSAAEAGLEAALGGAAVGGTVPVGSDSTYIATKDSYGAGQEFIFPEKIARDDTQQVWLVEHDSNNAIIETPYYTNYTINICWGNETISAGYEPALEATLIYKQTGAYKIQKYAYDPLSTRVSNNSFTLADNNTGQCTTTKGKYYTTLSFPSLASQDADNLYLAVRLRLLYNLDTEKQSLVVTSTGDDLPAQGKLYTSTGTVKIAGSDQAEMRTLNFHKSYPYLPGIFDFALFSGTAITK